VLKSFSQALAAQKEMKIGDFPPTGNWELLENKPKNHFFNNELKVTNGIFHLLEIGDY